MKRPKTATSKSSLKIAPSFAGLLLSHKRQSKFQLPDDFIFCREDGSPLIHYTVRKALHQAMDECGIQRIKGKHGFHIFRHSAGSMLYKKSRDLKMVQGTLRHADISTTSDIYVHLDDEVLGEGTVILAEEILGNCDPTVTQESKMVS